MIQINFNIRYKIKLVLILVMMLNICGCEQQQGSQLTSTQSTRSDKKNAHPKQLWGRLRNNFNMTTKIEKDAKDPQKNQKQAKVQKYVKKYTHQQKSLKKLTRQAEPYLYHIVEELEKRDMPGELALLPIIESAFKPQATSHKGAAGLWQFIPSTGRHFGLKQDNWYDGRRDITASTKAALDYLQFLHKEFDQNWMLALAAYNSGEGTVRRAIKRNIRAGKPTNFWDLKLPKETVEYVPKFLALAEVIGNPEKHDISLPTIVNQPYFTSVNAGSSLKFQQAAKLAEIDLSELKRLNPGYRRASTPPKGPQQLLLPVANAEKFEYNLAKTQ